MVSIFTPSPPPLGILGGLGPFASAAFLNTIYELNCGVTEQEMPRCILYSDPTIPDRTEAIESGSPDRLIAHFRAAVAQLLEFGAGRIVIPCITIHHFLPALPPSMQARIVSLIDITIDETARLEKRQLMLCTSGTRKARIFEGHPRWPLAQPYVVWPDAQDQRRVHDWVYAVKRTGDIEGHIETAARLCEKYDASSLIAGCTELHLMTRAVQRDDRWNGTLAILDPLSIVSRRLGELLATEAPRSRADCS